MNTGNTLHTSTASPNGGRKRLESTGGKKVVYLSRREWEKETIELGKTQPDRGGNQVLTRKGRHPKRENIRPGKHSGTYLRRGPTE